MEMGQKAESAKQANQTFSVVVRIVDELCRPELTQSLLASITALVFHLVRQSNYTLSRLLRSVLVYLTALVS